MLECKTKNSIVNGLKIIQNLLQYNIHARNIIIEQRAHFTSIKNRIAETKEIDVECETMPKFLKQNTDPLSSFENEDRFALPPNLCSPTNEQNEHIAKCVENVVNALDGHLEEFIRILLDDTKYRPLRSTAGIIQKPLGLIRLEIVHLFVALFATSNLHIMRKCYDLKVLCILTDLFFSYPLNNQLHKYYEQIIHYIFQYYHNFAFTKHFKYSNRDHPSCEDNVDEPKNDVGNDKDAGEAKISELDEFYEIFKLLVVQILSECNLISKILDHYSTEKVPMKSYEKEMILKNEKTRLIKSETNFNDVDMCDEVSHENRDKIEPNTNLENNETNCEKIAPIKLRPSYMGHLRMIANILNECCSEQLLSEEFCLDDELIAQWNEFRNGHLKKLNELIGSKIVPNLQYNTVHNDLFDEIGNKIYNAYQAEVVSEQTLPDKIQLLPSSFGQNLCSSFNYGMKLENNLLDNAIDLDQFLNKTNDFAEFSKQFEYSANIPSREFNDDEDDDDDENDNPFAEIKSRKNFPTFAANVLREDFITLERINSTTSTSDDDNIDEFDDYFACTDVFSSEVSNEKKSTIGNELKNESIPWYQTSTSENNLNESNCVKFESDENWATFNDDAFLAETEKDFDPTTLAIDPESSGNNPEVTFDSLPDQIRANENDKEVDAIGSFLEENSANKEQEQKDTEKNDNDEDDDDVFVSNIQSTSSPILN
ncbi:hypothetical protein NH340_JMT02252 [Sarcoptes scabiei]|nr:hypothetical protein NH340_JMT02252 [Sarcoptes scabiei]